MGNSVRRFSHFHKHSACGNVVNSDRSFPYFHRLRKVGTVLS
nr:MAG TPA: hypothetical protein [Microviridae sp.]